MKCRYIVIVFSILSLQVNAIDIGPMTAVMESSQTFISRTITNNDNAPKIYEIRVSKISNPTANGQQIDMIKGELLFSPKRFILHPNQVQNVKFYYKGALDHHERYFRVSFIESPTAQNDKDEEGIRRGTLEVKLELQSILVIRPNKIDFSYKINKNLSTITNTGNTFFEFMIKDGCEQSEGIADSKYLLPGDTYHNIKISGNKNHKFIVFQSRFIQVDNDCW
ncbi:fimbria/pilus periplasmic chaperone [Aeromonas veronii]